MVKKLRTERDLMKDALQDLVKELKALRASKSRLEKKANASSSKYDNIQAQMIRLRELISLAMKKEAVLVKKRTILKDKIQILNNKIDKVESIRRELKEV